jgi:hypothetical protein
MAVPASASAARFAEIGAEERCGDDRAGGEGRKRLTEHVRMARELGRKIATGDEARRILKIGVTYNSFEETLINLGLPPNRQMGQTGFVGYTTDGKLPTPRAGRWLLPFAADRGGRKASRTRAGDCTR